MNSEPKKSRWIPRALLLILAVLGLVLAAAAFFAPAIVETAVGSWASGQGLAVTMEGFEIGTHVGADRWTIGLPDQPAPFLEARGIRIEPGWGDILRGSWNLRTVSADSISIRFDEALSSWLKARPESGGTSSWRIDRLDVASWSASAYGWTLTGAAHADGLKPGGVDSATVTASTGTGIAGIARTDSGRLLVNVAGTSLPPAIASIPGIDPATRGWTLAASALMRPSDAEGPTAPTPAPDPSASPLQPSPTPAWFEALLQHDAWARAELRTESGISGHVAVTAHRESGCILLDARAGSTLLVEGHSSFGGETLTTALSYHARPRGEASLTGSLDLVVLPRENFRILPGSAWTLARSSVSGTQLPEGRVGFSGDHERGYEVTSAGSLGAWSMAIDARQSSAEWKGELSLRQAGPLRDLLWSGEASLRAATGSLAWSARGIVKGRADAGATPVRFELRGDAHGENDRITASLPLLRVEDARSPAAMALVLTDLKVSGTSRDWRTEPGAGGRLVLRGRTLSLGIVARGDAESAELAPLTVAGIPVRVRATFPGGRYRETAVTIDQTPLAELVDFLPGAQKSIVARSELSGTWQAAFRHTADRRLVGNLNVRVAKFRDPVTKFIIENLEADIPIRQRFVDPSQVQFVTQEERWPDVPVNVKIGVLGQDNIRVQDVTGRAVFADYVFRFRDLSFGILGGRASSRFIVDPFRNAQGRWRAALELKVNDVPLKNLYEAFIGKGAASRGLEGALSLELETGWSDTECVEGRGSLSAAGPGKVGRRVLAALVQMMEKEKRPPAIALALIGDYNFDEFRIDLVRDPDINDFRTNLLLSAGNEPFLGEVKLEMPLLQLLSGLPVEVEHDIGLRRGR